jgi:three-Cys-motif partner protein
VKCPKCDSLWDERNTRCSCGLIRTGPGTKQKYEILADYLPELSKIMRYRGYEHYLIDACAGSGTVFDPENGIIVDGSPLIMAKTRDEVQKRIKDKTKEPQANCIFIEVDRKTFHLLEETIAPFSAYCHCVQGDCNERLDKELDQITSAVKERNHFAFVYIDPFGLGAPTIRHETLQRVLNRPFTELLVHFNWEGVSRVAGSLNNINAADATLRKTAESHCATLDSYLPGWREIEVRNLPPDERRSAYVELYKTGLQQHFQNVVYVEIPTGAGNPDYFLFFATRNDAGHSIMSKVISKVKRRGMVQLAKFVGSTDRENGSLTLNHFLQK